MDEDHELAAYGVGIARRSCKEYMAMQYLAKSLHFLIQQVTLTFSSDACQTRMRLSCTAFSVQALLFTYLAHGMYSQVLAGAHCTGSRGFSLLPQSA